MSERGRAWSLRLLALGIAIGIWFNASVEDRLVPSEKVVEAGVSYNRPRGFVIINPVQSVKVRLTGSEKEIRQLNPFNVDVQVELTQRQAGSATITLGAENVRAPKNLEVSSIEPSTIRVELEREISQRLPVVPILMGKPAAGTVVDDPEVFPSQVLVTGPESLLSRVESLPTRPIRLEGHAATFEEIVPVVPPDPLIQIIQPAQVTVKIPIRRPGQEDENPPRKEDP